MFLSIVLKRFLQASFLAFCLTATAHASTIVDVYTSIGNFKVEIYDDQYPDAAGRFTGQLGFSRYDSTIFHYADDSYIAGGIYTYKNCPPGPVRLFPYPVSLRAESTGLANTTGTIALLRDPHNADFLTNDFIINLQDNPVVDPVTDPVVVGRVLTGMDTLLAIKDQVRVSMGDDFPNVPTIRYTGESDIDCESFGTNNVIYMDMERVYFNDFYTANHFDTDKNRLKVTVDVGASGFWSLYFDTFSSESETTIQALPETFIIEPSSVDGIANFDSSTGVLTIPELSILGEVVYRNLVFTLTDEESLRFTLQSFE